MGYTKVTDPQPKDLSELSAKLQQKGRGGSVVTPPLQSRRTQKCGSVQKISWLSVIGCSSNPTTPKSSKEPVQSGRVLAVGPGIAIPNFAADDSEPWKDHHSGSAIRYIPVQAEIGDYALFLRKEAVEIRYCGEHFVVVPQSAILLLIRDEDLTSTLLEH